jgi:hypothetical protein
MRHFSAGGAAIARAEHGVAMLVALIVVMLLSAIGLGLVTLSNTERAIAGNFQDVQQGRLAAEAILERVLLDIRRSDSSDLLSGLAQSSFRDADLTPVAPWGTQLDLPGMTAAIQAQSDAASGWSPNNPRWQLLASGPFAQLVGSESPLYLVAWVGDDLAETDGNPLADTNGIVVILARAIGPSGLAHTVRAAVLASAGARLLSFRELR